MTNREFHSKLFQSTKEVQCYYHNIPGTSNLRIQRNHIMKCQFVESRCSVLYSRHRRPLLHRFVVVALPILEDLFGNTQRPCKLKKKKCSFFLMNQATKKFLTQLCLKFCCPSTRAFQPLRSTMNYANVQERKTFIQNNL